MDIYSLMYGEFFYCKECDFEFSKLGQGSYSIEGCCSSCGSDDIDYLPVNYIKNHIERLKVELEALQSTVRTNRAIVPTNELR